MNLEQKIKQAIEYKKILETNLFRIDAEINRLNNLIEISPKDLLLELGTIKEIDDISKTKGLIFVVEKHKHAFFYTDKCSTSQSLTEKETTICTVKSDYYLTDETKEIIKIYLKALLNIKSFKFTV